MLHFGDDDGGPYIITTAQKLPCLNPPIPYHHFSFSGNIIMIFVCNQRCCPNALCKILTSTLDLCPRCLLGDGDLRNNIYLPACTKRVAHIVIIIMHKNLVTPYNPRSSTN